MKGSSSANVRTFLWCYSSFFIFSRGSSYLLNAIKRLICFLNNFFTELFCVRADKLERNSSYVNCSVGTAAYSHLLPCWKGGRSFLKSYRMSSKIIYPPVLVQKSLIFQWTAHLLMSPGTSFSNLPIDQGPLSSF